MNAKMKAITKSMRKEKLEYSDRSHVGCIKVSPSNTLKHELAKFLTCFKMKGGKLNIPEDFNLKEFWSKIEKQIGDIEVEEFITEARSIKGDRRYDIYGMNSRVFEFETGKSYPKNDETEEIKI